MTAAEQANATTVRRLYEEYLNENRAELLPSLVTEGLVLHLPTEERGIAAYAALTERLRIAFHEMQFALLDLIASDDRVVVRWTMDATHAGPLAGIPATGKRVQQRGTVIYRMEEGKIAEIWAQMDRMGMLQQLGIDPLAGVKAVQAR
ncbi:MAG TPA: ester cyclase [Acidobacteriaceae bacterium]|jgi:steroid delta-isomerase-like uncharacterized protein